MQQITETPLVVEEPEGHQHKCLRVHEGVQEAAPLSVLLPSAVQTGSGSCQEGSRQAMQKDSQALPLLFYWVAQQMLGLLVVSEK